MEETKRSYMVKIVLIRPGATEYDEQRRIQGTLDVPLSPRGSREVERLIDELAKLDIQYLYSCPCRSARQTAEAISDALDIRLKRLDKLANVNHGLWQGRCLEEVRQTQPKVYKQWIEHPEQVCPPEGETLADARTRADEAMSKLLKKHKDGVIAVVAPEPMAGLMRCHLEGKSLRDVWKSTPGSGRFEVLTIEPAALVAQ
jgi:broad specificity phosphatase PhoE